MRPETSSTRAAVWARVGIASLLLSLLPAAASAGLKVYDSKDLTLELGMRLQPRMEYEFVSLPAGGTDTRRDFMVRRARLKANGLIQGVSYGFEWKIDGTDQFGAAPVAAVENAWMGSTPHRAAILDDAYTAVGIAATSSADGRVWITVHFGGSI